jgi:hypothetical protein
VAGRPAGVIWQNKVPSNKHKHISFTCCPLLLPKGMNSESHQSKLSHLPSSVDYLAIRCGEMGVTRVQNAHQQHSAAPLVVSTVTMWKSPVLAEWLSEVGERM